MKNILSLFVGLFFTLGVFAQGNVVGNWKTIDDQTGEMKSIVKIEIINGKLYGTVISLKNESDKNVVCTECSGSKKGKKIVGMRIIEGLKNADGVWEGDDGIMDPENGKYYDCKIWEEGGKLQVRGYIGFIYRTQTWIKA